MLLASYRSGSTWFIDVLNHVKGTAAYSELFSIPATKAGTQTLDSGQSEQTTRYLEQSIRAYPHYYERESSGPRIRPFSIYSYLNTFYQQEEAVGFKLMYPQLARHPEIWTYIVGHRIRVVHLVRKNHLDVIISREMRKVTNTTHRVAGSSETKTIQIALDPLATVARMRSLQRNIDLARRLIRLSRVQSLEVIYENLTRDFACFEPLWPFLQINDPPTAPESRLVKIVKAGYPAIISNYGEVQRAVRETEFADLLDG